MSVPFPNPPHPTVSRRRWPDPPHYNQRSLFPCATSRVYNTPSHIGHNTSDFCGPNALQLYTPSAYDSSAAPYQNEISWNWSSIVDLSSNYSWLDFCPSYANAFIPSSPPSSLSSASCSSGSTSASTSPALPSVLSTETTQHVVCTAPLVAPVPVPRARPPLFECELPDIDEDLSHPPYIRRPGKRKRIDDDTEINPMHTPLPLKRRAVAIAATPFPPVRSSPIQHRLLPRHVRR